MKNVIKKWWFWAIILFAVIYFFGAFSFRRTSHIPDGRRISDIRQLQSALDIYKNKHGIYPDTLDSLVSGGIINESVLKDPETKELYVYTKTEKGYILSARLLDTQSSFLREDFDPTNDIYEVGVK